MVGSISHSPPGFVNATSSALISLHLATLALVGPSGPDKRIHSQGRSTDSSLIDSVKSCTDKSHVTSNPKLRSARGSEVIPYVYASYPRNVPKRRQVMPAFWPNLLGQPFGQPVDRFRFLALFRTIFSKNIYPTYLKNQITKPREEEATQEPEKTN